MLNTAILVCGDGTAMQAVIDAQKNGIIADAKIGLVVSSVKDAPALEKAAEAGIKTLVFDPADYADAKVWEDALAKELKRYRIDLVVIAEYVADFSENFTKHFPNRIINVHPSLIPAFIGEGMRGLRVHQAAIDIGVKITGATVYYTGPCGGIGEIIAQKAVEVLRGDTAEILAKRVTEKAVCEILPRAVQIVAEDAALGNIIANTRCISEGRMKDMARELAGMKSGASTYKNLMG